MKKLTLMALALGLISLYSCKPEPVEDVKQSVEFQARIACLSDVGLPGVDIKVEMDDGTAYELTTDEQGMISFSENPAASCYSLKFEKNGAKAPTPDMNDVSAIDTRLSNPGGNNFPDVVYDINRDQMVNDSDREELMNVIADLENAPNYPWTFIQIDGNDDFSCLTPADFEQSFEIIGYRLSDFNGSDCE